MRRCRDAKLVAKLLSSTAVALWRQGRLEYQAMCVEAEGAASIATHRPVCKYDHRGGDILQPERMN